MSQGHSKLGDVVVAQLKYASAHIISVVAADLYVEIDQVPETLNWGDERSVDVDTQVVFDVQDFQ